MTPARNPEFTTPLGAFAWDVIPGFYRITAARAGCRPPRGRSVAGTPVLRVPPPRVGLRIVLACKHLSRARTQTSVRKRRLAGHLFSVLVSVRALGGRHRPVGIVRLSAGPRTLVHLALAGRRAQVTAVLSAATARRARATYEGDGYNQPSASR